MNEVFGSLYAGIYDTLYCEKNYDEECKVIRSLFDSFAEGKIFSVLDMGCGTGNHAFRLIDQGYKVTGVDRSEGMLDIARKKAKEGEVSVAFFHSDIKTVVINQTFDAAIVMFAVLGYQISNTDVIQTLRNIRKHIRKGGLLVFDVWYGPAVLSQKPGERFSVIEGNDSKVIRHSSGILNTFHHVCNVHYHVYKIERKQLVDETIETHQMRFFFPQEVVFFLENAGFEMVHIGPFPGYEGDLNENTWNVLVVGRGI